MRQTRTWAYWKETSNFDLMIGELARRQLGQILENCLWWAQKLGGEFKRSLLIIFDISKDNKNGNSRSDFSHTVVTSHIPRIDTRVAQAHNSLYKFRPPLGLFFQSGLLNQLIEITVRSIYWYIPNAL